jgi:hypothetical protein
MAKETEFKCTTFEKINICNSEMKQNVFNRLAPKSPNEAASRSHHRPSSGRPIDPLSFLRHPSAFGQFLHEHWKEAYANSFVFILQPINSALPCLAVYGYPAENEKGTTNTVSKLLRLRDILQTQFHFRAVVLVFNADFCFNTLHDDFASVWPGRLTRDPAFRAILRDILATICDPLHLLKRIQYCLLSLASVISEKERIDFDISRVQNVGLLSPVVFNNSCDAKSTIHFRSSCCPRKRSRMSFFGQYFVWRGYHVPFVPYCRRPDVSRHNDAYLHRTSGNRIWDVIRVCPSCESMPSSKEFPAWLAERPRRVETQSESLPTTGAP